MNRQSMLVRFTRALSKISAITAGLALFTAAHAAEITGTVVGVSDGDTITVLDTQRQQYKVRLSGIDAPEKGQAFGSRSKEYLASMVFQKQVTVYWDKKDRYGRIVGKVVLPSGTDACLAQISAGYAWHFKKYEREQPSKDRLEYAAEERLAREQKRGLWTDQSPVAPWDFRRNARAGTE